MAQEFKKKLRLYELDLVRSAVVNASFTGSIQIDPGVNFYLTSMHAADTADGAALTSQEPWLVQIQDNENGYLWADGLVERSSMFADRVFGYQLPDAYLLRNNTRIQLTVQNRAAGAVAGTAKLVLRGYSLVPVD